MRDTLNAQLSLIQRKYGVPGLGLYIQQGSYVEQLVIGQRSSSANTPLLLSDTFHFGSCGKAVTSMLIHLLADENRLSLNSTLGSLLPTITFDSQSASITITQLLVHTSGLPANAPNLNKLHQQAQSFTPRQIRLELAMDILKQKPQTLPGKTYQYSNVGYILLGVVAETLLNTPYEQLVKDKIFKLLGMETAGFGPTDRVNSATPQSAWAHIKENNVYKAVVYDNPTAYAPAGTIHASLNDWMKFLQRHLQNLKPNTQLPCADMGNQAPFYTTLALIQSTYNNKPVYLHDGSNTYNYCRVYYDPSFNSTIIITTNAGDENAKKAIDEMNRFIQEKIIPVVKNPSLPLRPSLSQNPSLPPRPSLSQNPSLPPHPSIPALPPRRIYNKPS